MTHPGAEVPGASGLAPRHTQAEGPPSRTLISISSGKRDDPLSGEGRIPCGSSVEGGRQYAGLYHVAKRRKR